MLQRVRLSSLSKLQRRFASQKLAFEAQLPTTENYLRSIGSDVQPDEVYKSKHPNVTIEQYESDLQQQLLKQYTFTEDFKKFVQDKLGYTKEDVEIACSAKFPSFTKVPEVVLMEGDEDINWDVVRLVFSGTPAREEYIRQIESSWKSMRVFLSDNKEFKPTEINWAYWEKALGAERVAEIKKEEERLLAAYDGMNMDKTLQGILKIANPLFEQAKDSLVENLQQIAQLNKDLDQETPLLQVDETGFPKYNFDSIDILDEFYPELRDRIIEEIERGELDPDYSDDRKKIKINTDSLMANNKVALSKEAAKTDDKINYELTVVSSVTPQQKLFQQLYYDVVTIAKKNAEMEAEVNQLRFQVEAEAEEEGKKGKTAAQIDPKAEAIIDAIVKEEVQKKSGADRKKTREFEENERMKEELIRQIKNINEGKPADFKRDDSAPAKEE